MTRVWKDSDGFWFDNGAEVTFTPFDQGEPADETPEQAAAREAAAAAPPLDLRVAAVEADVADLDAIIVAVLA